jgi:hypothetical protein
MDLEAIYYGVEIASGLTVIGSLIFVGLQLNQNTRAIQANAAFAYTQLWAETARDNFVSPEWAEVLVRGIADYDELNDIEKFRHNEYLTRGMKQIEFIYQQYIVGNLTEDQWRANRSALLRSIAWPPFRRYWQRRGREYDQRFQDLVAEMSHDYDERQAQKTEQRDATT